MKRYQGLALGLTAYLALSFLSVVHAAEPQFSSLKPWGFQRGTEVEVIFSGNRLADAEEVLLYEPGIEVKSVEPVDDRNVKATFAVADDCKLGQHAMRIRTKSGVSEVQLFYIGALPIVDEVEPNNDFFEPQPIELNSTIHGVVQNEDEDYFVVEAKKGQRITAELEGLRLGRTFFDPYVAILNESRFELAKSDDAPLVYQDSLCSIIAPEDGKYIIQVRESSYGGNGNCVYRLHVGTFPRPLGVHPAGGKPGEEVEITWLGDAAGEHTTTVKLPAEEGIFEYFAEDEHGIAPSPNRMFVANVPTVSAQEPNNTRETATPMEAPGAAFGVLSEKGDEDYYKFTATKDQQFDVRVQARDIMRSPLDPVLNVLNATGGNVGGNDDNAGSVDSYYRFKAPADGEYFVRVRDHLGSGSPIHAYRVEIAAIQQEIAVSLPEVQQYVARTISVPQGNYMAAIFAARRQNVGGELEFNFDDLPEGIEIITFPLAADQSNLPVLFRAKPDAPLAGKLTEVTAKPTDSNVDVTGKFLQRSMLVRGQNNRDMWGHDADRMALLVTEEVPFTLEIVQPKVPLVRDGSMQLKVVAKRAEGFEGEISLRLLYDPSGVSASRSIKIKKDESEALIPVTANGNAAIGTWKMTVLGTAPHKAGNVEIATPFVDLEVADRYFDLALGKTAVEQGNEVPFVVDVTKKKDFEGEAVMELVGLPAGATAEPVKITKDSEKAVFTIKTTPEAKDGRHKSVLTRTTVVENGEPILHTLGTGELRIDKPRPAPQVAAADKPKEEAPKPKAEEAPKPLSRLEQLRQAAAEGGE